MRMDSNGASVATSSPRSLFAYCVYNCVGTIGKHSGQPDAVVLVYTRQSNLLTEIKR